jgi:hypothetical protein
MKTTRRTFIKQSTIATLTATGIGSLAWKEMGCAQETTVPPKTTVAASKEVLDFLQKAPGLAGSLNFQEYLSPIYQNDETPAINRVPYISQYYIQPKVDAGKDVVIDYYVTDYLQSEYAFDDTSQVFTVDFWINGKKQSVANVKAGDNSFTLKGLPKGKVLLAFQATDSKGRKSHRLFQEFLVVDPREEAIPESKIFHPDLQKFGIYNDDTHPVETTAGLTKMLQWASDNGYRKVLLPQGKYLLDENMPVNMATQLTLDMNGSTFRLNPSDLKGIVMLEIAHCFDSHVVNGTFEGDWNERKAAKLPLSEHVRGVTMGQNATYCSVENIKVTNITGYGTTTWMGVTNPADPKMNSNYTAAYIKPGVFVPGDIDAQGKDVASTERLSTTKPVDISKFVDTFGFLQMGLYLGYQGNPAGGWVYQAHFYDADHKHLETIEGYMYRRLYIPQGAKFARFTLLSNATPEAVKGLTLFNFRQPYNCTFRNVVHENVRSVGMVPSGFYNLLVEGCSFENCGFNDAKCAFDSEDGWDMMQDLTFRNNVFKKNPHNEFLTADGLNFVIENNVMSTYMYDRTKGSVYRNNTFRTGFLGAATFHFGNRNRTSYPRIYNNTFDGRVNLSTATAAPTCAYAFRDNTCLQGGATSRKKGATIDAAYFYRCKISGGTLNATVMKSSIKNFTNIGGIFALYNCDVVGEVIKISGPASLSIIADSAIKDVQIMNLNSALLLKDNTIIDSTFQGGQGWIETMEFTLIGNKITTSKSYLLALGNSFKAVIFDKNTVTSTDPKFIAINTINPQAKTNKALMVAVTKSTFTGKGGTVFNVGFVPAAGTLLSLYAKDNKYTGIDAINPKAFSMKTVKLAEEYPPAA